MISLLKILVPCGKKKIDPGVTGSVMYSCCLLEMVKLVIDVDGAGGGVPFAEEQYRRGKFLRFLVTSGVCFKNISGISE